MQRQSFIVDAMLGRLARWLRILGYDTYYKNDIKDWKILKIAEETKRIIITRDRGLCNRAKKKGLPCELIQPGICIEEMLVQLANNWKIDLTLDMAATRCPECDSILEQMGKDRWKCPKCSKEYWKGTHWITMQEIIIKAKAKVNTNGEEPDFARRLNVRHRNSVS
ncbi:Mut7-C RNAse domain-containing protein [Sulfuracidifex tepidarius]|uniref:Mut7-C RNAse domain-containing protein n=1 Tax=Sulfuracidifex tepidarius TaxID=1294262 RepID=A0A510E493_9CREN|nr:Mut7-C RNAse domain-containing protein [Sulfuracidifex tepidarius]BBG27324.1 hypothetical protein IC007_1869 [Sulfuracidifex tepidarius]